jgi:uncharacterized protein YdhG (YjbR/CyaY superfamily)
VTKPEDSAAARIDEILARLPADQRTALQSLRTSIAAAAPQADEAISYAAPAFRYRGHPLVAYSAAKAHLSFFPMSPGVLDAFRTELVDYELSKGTVRFTPDHPIPEDVIRRIVGARVAELDGRAD